MSTRFLRLDRGQQLLLINEFTVSLSFYMLYPYLAVYFTRDLGMATGAVGLVLGIRVLCQQGLTILGGTLADRIGFKPVIVAGLALRTIGFGMFAFVSSFPGVLLASILSGLAGALFSPAVRGYIATQAEGDRAEAFALNNIAGRAGMLLGPPLGVVLLAVSFQAMSLVAGGLFLLLALMQFAALPRTALHHATATTSVMGAWREVFANRPFILFSLAMLGSLALFNQLYLGLPLEVTRVTGGTAWAGMLFTLSGLMTIFGQLYVTRWCRRWPAPRSLAWGLALMGLAFVPPMLTQSILPVVDVAAPLALTINLTPVALSGALLTLGLMITNPLSQELIPILGRERLTGTYFGVFSMAGGLAATLTTAGSGAAFDVAARLGAPVLPWALMAATGIASSVAMYALDRAGILARGETRADRAR